MTRLALLLVAVAGACRAPEELAVTGGYAYAVPGGSEVSVYFTIRNPADRPDTVVHVNAAEAAGVMFHRNVTVGGLVTMEHLETVVVPARDSLVLEPGGIHLMLTDVRPAASGDSLRLSLAFARAGNRLIAVPVLAPGDEPPARE